MVKRFILSVAASGALFSAVAADYFPVQERNAWTFSYTSTSMPVVPNPTTTKDSGTVKWDIFENRNVEMVNIYSVKQTRCLIRRTQTRSDTSFYDSIYLPPRTTIDTIILRERIDQVGIDFPAATCAFAVHDPTTAMPAGLSSKDTVVSFQGASIDCKKMIVSECSCLPKTMRSYSFTLGPVVGPVGAYVTACGTGLSFKETWQLIIRDYPITVVKGNSPHAAIKTVAADHSSGRITCSMNLEYSSPVRIDLFDVKGRLIKTVFTGYLDAGAHQYTWNNLAKAFGIALLRMRTGTEDRCIRLITGGK